ncbi:MAG: alpha-galactosidase [Clostridiaceae bacterium]|nr:alpha-galactosidase [Clostridiaceae bacterium]
MFYRDCFYTFDGATLTLGNRRICRTLRIDGRALVSVAITSGTAVWTNPDALPRLALAERFLSAVSADTADTAPAVTADIDCRNGLSAYALAVRVVWDDGASRVAYTFRIYPELPFVVTECSLDVGNGAPVNVPDVVDGVGLPQGHYTLEATRLVDQSDRHDTYLLSSRQTLYRSEDLCVEGNLFSIHDPLSGDGLLLVRDAPTTLSSPERTGQGLSVPHAAAAVLTGTGVMALTEGHARIFGATIGAASTFELPSLYRALYRAEYAGEPRGLYSLANNWGDRHMDGVICEDFMLREIDAAASTGVDVVQLDDGWQKGTTTGSLRNANGVWEGYYAYMSDYWTPDRDKFPKGLGRIAAYAKERGVSLGLWFSPDSSDDFSNWPRDAETLLGFYRDFGIATFKLDGVKLRTMRGKSRYLELLDALREGSGGKIAVNQDITANARLGVVCEKPYGTLFVENRYTDWGNYYPHRTLRNLWMLSRWFPARRFQFELLNLRRNAEKYAGDPLAPGEYTMDYVFASVMLANPLVWMELQHLPESDRAVLADTIAVWKKYRKDFFSADVSPISDEPSGVSWTGFEVRGTRRYALLFRERTPDARHAFPITGSPEKLTGSDGFTLTADGIAESGKPFTWGLFAL